MDHPLGAYQNPMSYAQVLEKFCRCAGEILPDEKAHAIIDAVDSMETKQVTELMRLMRWTD